MCVDREFLVVMTRIFTRSFLQGVFLPEVFFVKEVFVKEFFLPGVQKTPSLGSSGSVGGGCHCDCLSCFQGDGDVDGDKVNMS